MTTRAISSLAATTVLLVLLLVAAPLPAAAQDLRARQLLRLFVGVTNKKAAWATSDLADWVCGASGAKCCVAVEGRVSCTFTDLEGRLDAAITFSDQSVEIYELAIRNTPGAARPLRGTFDFYDFRTNRCWHLNLCDPVFGVYRDIVWWLPRDTGVTAIAN